MRLKNNIEIVECKNKIEASKKALKLLLGNVDQETLLLLSGGTSPDLLYQLIAQDKTLQPGAIALIDERYGPPMHGNSNEKIISSTGLVEYLNKKEIPFYGILKEDNMETTVEQYEQTIKNLFKKFSKKIAIMGVGADGHTAGIKPGLDYDHTKLVVAYDDAGAFGKRITLSFEALEQIDEFIILAFGESKKEALKKMFQGRDREKLPAVFYTEILAKVSIITDTYS